MGKSKQEQKKEEESTVYQVSNFTKYLIILVIIIVVVIAIAITIYRYLLIGKAINHDEYITAVALGSPELGWGVSALSTYIL